MVHNDLEWVPTVGRAGSKKGAWTRKKVKRRRAELAAQSGQGRQSARAAREARRQKQVEDTIHAMGRVTPTRRERAEG